MNLHNKSGVIISLIFITSILFGELAFILTGGITGLKADIGLSGAWFLSLVFQVLFALLSFSGFILFLIISKYHRLLDIEIIPTLLSAALIPILIPFMYSTFKIAESISYYLFAFLFIALSFLSYLSVTALYNKFKK